MRIEEIWRCSEEHWLSVTRDCCSIPNMIQNLANWPASKATIVLCHGLTGDKIGPQKLLSDLSAYLACRCGVEVVRFDFRGAGLSSGSFTETSLSSMCEDALFLSSHFEKPLIWMGISTGALIALMAAAKRARGERVIAISNGLAERVTFTNLEENPIPLRGGQLLLSKKFFIERSLLRPRTEYFPKVGAISVILGSDDKKHYSEFLSLQEAGVHVHTIEGGDHLFTKPEKRKELFSYLVEQLNETS